VFNILTEIFKRKTDHVAIQSWNDGKHLSETFNSLNEHSKINGNKLRNYIQPGDRVILLAESRSIEWVKALFAIWNNQATAVLIDPSLSLNDFAELIDRSDPSLIITTEGINPQLSANLPILNIADLTPLKNSNAPRKHNPDPDPSTACIIFTSGTTGKPHGVMLTHQGLYFVAHKSEEIAQLNKKEQVLALLPLNHVFGLVNVFLGTLLAGGTLTFISRISSAEIISAMQKAKITILPATPRLLELLHAKIIDQVNARGVFHKALFNTTLFLSQWIKSMKLGNPGRKLFSAIHKTFGGHLKKIISGSASLPKDLFEFFEGLGFSVIEGYGMTETSGIVSGNNLKHRKAGTVGHPVEGIELTIIHPNAGGEGEICISGPNIMKGYFRDSQATAETIRNGSLHTGDLGFLNKDGDLVISGRLKELIVTAAGKKAMPVDIEQRYSSLPGISELAIVGIKSSNNLGEEIHAAVVLSDQSKDQEDALEEVEKLIAQRSKDVPAHLRIQRVHVVPSIPKTSTLKVKRHVLKEQLINTDTKPKAPKKSTEIVSEDAAANEVIKILADHIQNRSLQNPVTIDSSLQFDLGIDSLDRVEIASKIEKALNTSINVPLLHTIDKVSDLIALSKSNNNQVYTEKNESTRFTVPKERGKPTELFFTCFKALSDMCWKTHVRGLQNLPKDQPYIICANHQSYLDAYWIFAYLPSKIRLATCCVARKELAENIFTAFMAHPVSIIPAERDGNALPAIGMSLAALKNQRPILIFPEGNRSREGEMRAFRRGAAHLALRANVPIVPVRIEGAFQIYPRHRLIPNLFDWNSFQRYTLSLNFGKPIYPSGSGVTKQAEEELIEQVKSAIQLLDTDDTDITDKHK